MRQRSHNGNSVEQSTGYRSLVRQNALMHRTRTVDYAIIMAGEIDMMLDEGTVHLKAGDVSRSTSD
jgi:hypothetical protein